MTNVTYKYRYVRGGKVCEGHAKIIGFRAGMVQFKPLFAKAVLMPVSDVVLTPVAGIKS
jgi:hypothetical protein